MYNKFVARLYLAGGWKTELLCFSMRIATAVHTHTPAHAWPCTHDVAAFKLHRRTNRVLIAATAAFCSHGCARAPPCSKVRKLRPWSDAPGGLHVSAADLAAARDGFAPAASWGVTRADAGAAAGLRGWDDVGGLPDAVAALREALALPTRFARLCARCALVQGRLLVRQGLARARRVWPATAATDLVSQTCAAGRTPATGARVFGDNASGVSSTLTCVLSSRKDAHCRVRRLTRRAAGRRCGCARACCCTGRPAAGRRTRSPPRWRPPACAMSASAGPSCSTSTSAPARQPCATSFGVLPLTYPPPLPAAWLSAIVPVLYNADSMHASRDQGLPRAGARRRRRRACCSSTSLTPSRRSAATTRPASPTAS
jgi:hypothetical protein